VTRRLARKRDRVATPFKEVTEGVEENSAEAVARALEQQLAALQA
jgi:hypothetical protein